MLGETTAARVYRCIKQAADQGASCPTDPQICEATGSGLTAVRKAIADLAKAGAISRVNADRSARVFLIAETGKQTSPYHPLSQGSRPIEQIIAICAKAAALTPADLRGKSRLPLYNRPRIICYYLANKLGWSTVAIGKALERDHGTVHVMIGTVAERVRKDRIFAMLLKRTETMIETIDPFVPVKALPPARSEPIADADEGLMDTDNRAIRMASMQLLAAIRREHPERFTALAA